MLRLLLAALHLLALGIGLGAVWIRARSLHPPLDGVKLKNAFAADALWGIAAVIWITTGLWRLFGATEKLTAFYLSNPLFHIKMTLLLAIIALEVWPMMTLIRWRVVAGRGAHPDTHSARRIATLSYIQAGIVVIMVFISVAMSRGFGGS